MRNPITTHVLDMTKGRPAPGIPVVLEVHSNDTGWKELARGETDTDGRINALLPENSELPAGIYRLTFQTAAYFQSCGYQGFYPYIPVVFELQDSAAHYHVPLLLSPYGYSTYRGS